FQPQLIVFVVLLVAGFAFDQEVYPEIPLSYLRFMPDVGCALSCLHRTCRPGKRSATGRV
ncbi:hypothetical protein, partial [Salmonella enterica]|uniref:hypothetical protein n=1 Tax=Salmonella enterica TaxID=28901 RepID=UPI001C998B5D